MPQSTSAAANQIGAEPVAFLYVALLYGGRGCILRIMADGLDAGHSTTKERAYVLAQQPVAGLGAVGLGLAVWMAQGQRALLVLVVFRSFHRRLYTVTVRQNKTSRRHSPRCSYAISKA